MLSTTYNYRVNTTATPLCCYNNITNTLFLFFHTTVVKNVDLRTYWLFGLEIYVYSTVFSYCYLYQIVFQTTC